MTMTDAALKVLFDGQSIYLPKAEADVYKLKAQLMHVNAELLIVSHLEDDASQPKQAEIFNRMLARLPQKELTTQVVYSSQPKIFIRDLLQLPSLRHVLLCGMQTDAVTELNKNQTYDNVWLLATHDIIELDNDAALKKAMWSEWMKQFGSR